MDDGSKPNMACARYVGGCERPSCNSSCESANKKYLFWRGYVMYLRCQVQTRDRQSVSPVLSADDPARAAAAGVA